MSPDDAVHLLNLLNVIVSGLLFLWLARAELGWLHWRDAGRYDPRRGGGTLPVCRRRRYFRSIADALMMTDR